MITTVILPAICVALAAFFKAVADTLSHHFDRSVFRWWDRRFWDASVSWQYAHFLRFTKYKIDGWHLANSLQIVSWCAALALSARLPFPWWLVFACAGLLFNLVFNLFYNRLLKK